MTSNPNPAEVLDLVTVAYAGDERPLGSFLALMGLYGGLASGLGAAAVRKGLPERGPVPDMVLLGVATAKLSRLLSRDRVTAAVLGAFLVKPRETRVVSSLFGLLTVSDLVQVGHEHLMAGQP